MSSVRIRRNSAAQPRFSRHSIRIELVLRFSRALSAVVSKGLSAVIRGPRWRRGSLPFFIVVPVDRRSMNAPGCLHRFKGHERRLDDGILNFFVVWPSRSMAQRKIEKDRTWRIHRSGNRKSARQTQRRNSLRLDFSRDQSHGLMTNRSDRDQQDEIDLVFDHASRNLRSQLLANAA